MANTSFPHAGMAVVIGASGGIGSALERALQSRGDFTETIALSRRSDPALELTDEASIAHAAQWVQSRAQPLRLVILATGFLHGRGWMPEKSLRQIDAQHMAYSFAVNAIGPALVMKHFLPLLPKSGKSVFAVLSAHVGSITDNTLGGWYSHRAAKAALNQLVRTAAIELARQKPEAICVALHPGTVATALSAPFSSLSAQAQPPDTAAQRLLALIDTLQPAMSGGFYDPDGKAIPW